MKKVLMVLVVMAVAVAFTSTVLAEQAKVTTTTKETASGATVTKEKVELKTPNETVKATDKTVTTKTQEGTVSTEKTKIVDKTKNPDKKEIVTIKSFNENDPKLDSDNTVTIVKDKQEVVMPVNKDWKVNHVQKVLNKTTTIYSTYNPEKMAYEISGFEGLTNK